MTPDFKKKAVIGIGVGLGLELLARLLMTGADPMLLVAVALYLVGTLIFIWGCTNYTLAKRLPHWLGYLGLFSIVGLAVLYLLPPRRSGPA